MKYAILIAAYILLPLALIFVVPPLSRARSRRLKPLPISIEQ
jgi:hypothetical protein